MLKRWYQAVSRVVFLRRVIAEVRARVPFARVFFSLVVRSPLAMHVVNGAIRY